MNFYINAELGYYQGDRLSLLDIPCPERKSQFDEPVIENGVFVKWQPNLAKYREKQSKLINDSFDSALANSVMSSQTLGIEVDVRRSATKNDLQNVQSLINYMTRNDIASIPYVGYTETVQATKEQVEALLAEMEDFGLGLYQYKWTKLAEIEAAQTAAEIEAVTW